MTHCNSCDCYLGGPTAIVRHLAQCHNIHVRLGVDSHLAYCEDCHRYLGTKHKAVCFSDARLALEKHLHLKHDLDLVTRHREAAEDE